MKLNRFYIIIMIIILASLTFSACASGQDAPAQAVEHYYQALVEKDQDRMVSLTCAEFESQALLEFDSFVSVETTLADFSCETVSQEDGTAQVTCQGAISASYQGEVRDFPLSGQTYQVIQQAGEWLMCGYE
jgi:hypothetical protein